MKKIIYILSSLFLVIFMFHSCEDLEEVVDPNFEIAFNTTAKVGEPVEFKIENAPDFLYFYSGNFGHKYVHKDRVNADGSVALSFKNAQKWGIGTNATGTLSLLVSSNYDESGTPEAVSNATWIDISDRVSIATAYSFTWTETIDIDITNLANGKPIYFAFKFYAEDNIGNGNRQPEWRIDDFKIETTITGAPAPLNVATMDIPGWNTVDVQGVISAWNTAKWYFTNGYWRFRGQPSDYTNEDWLITKAINLTKVNPDKGIPLKTYSEKLESFTYTYDKSGTYTITFIGNNETIHGQKDNIKEYTITVTD